jgi:hypothetical protein
MRLCRPIRKARRGRRDPCIDSNRPSLSAGAIPDPEIAKTALLRASGGRLLVLTREMAGFGFGPQRPIRRRPPGFQRE